MVRSGFREYEEEKLRSPAWYRQENANFSPHIHGTWEANFCPSLYTATDASRHERRRQDEITARRATRGRKGARIGLLLLVMFCEDKPLSLVGREYLL